MLQNLLKTCGLNDTEQAVLLFLAKNSKSLASTIARHCKVKRPTTYAALESLIRLGVAHKIKSGSVTYFSAVEPELLGRVLKAQARSTYEEVAKASDLIVENLKTLSGTKKDFGDFEVQTFESMELVYLQLEDALSSGDFCALFNPNLAVKGKFKPLVWSFLEKSKQTRAQIRELVVPGTETDAYRAKIQNPRHELKTLPSRMDLKSDIIITSDSVIVNNYEKRSESTIRIREKDFHDSMQSIFDALWERN